MNRDLSINVNVNPNGAASPTQVQPTQTPELTSADNRTKGNAVAGAAMLSIVQRGTSLAIANIGELTGSKTAQRNAQRAASIATLGYAAATNPASAVLLVTAQLSSAAIQNGIQNRNQQLQVDYNRTLKQNLYNNNRR